MSEIVILIDGSEVEVSSEVYSVHYNLGHPATWKFGDILKFNDGLVDKARLMFVTSHSTGVTVLTLDDHFDPAGTIQYYNRSALARAED